MSNSKGRAVTLASVALVAVAGFGYAWKNNLLQGNVFDWGSEPIIKIQPSSEDSMHVEYPSVYKVGDATALMYSGYGDDHRWRIKLATSQSGGDFIKQGNIFDEKKLPFKGGYAFPFVRKASVAGTPFYEMYFSVTEDGASNYSAIYRSTSANGLSWGAPKKLIGESALDPIVFNQNGQDIILYTASIDGSNVIKAASLNVDGTAGPSRIVYSPDGGLYTLGVVHVNDKSVIFVETEMSWEAMCFGASGNLIAASAEPVFQFKESTEQKWDGLKYGMYFFEDANAPAIYYNGIEAHGVEQGGQIGVGSYKLDNLSRKLKTVNCL